MSHADSTPDPQTSPEGGSRVRDTAGSDEAAGASTVGAAENVDDVHEGGALASDAGRLEPASPTDDLAGGDIATDRDVPPEAIRPDLPAPRTPEDLVSEPATRCLNCDAELPGPFCPACGQRAERLRQPVHVFLRDAVAELFGVDGRVWRTLGTLLAKPGTLTRAYLEGRRRRYLTPLRVYLVATLSFFVLLALMDPAGGIEFGSRGASPDSTVRVADLREAYDADLARYDSLRTVGDSAATLEEIEARVRARAEVDSSLGQTAAGRIAGEALSEDEREALIDDMVEAAQDSLDLPDRDHERRMRVARGILSAMPPDDSVRVVDLRAASAEMVPEVNINLGNDDGLPGWFLRSDASRQLVDARSAGEVSAASTRLLRSALRQIPTVLFLLLPIYALLLKLLYVRRDWYYSEHVVFGLHVHAFAFAVGSLILLVSASGWWGSGITAFYVLAGLSIPAYFVIAQKRVYRQGWRKTLAKAIVLGFVYGFLILTAGIMLTIALTAIRG